MRKDSGGQVAKKADDSSAERRLNDVETMKPASPASQTAKGEHLWKGAVIVLLAILVYLPAIRGGLIRDE